MALAAVGRKPVDQADTGAEQWWLDWTVIETRNKFKERLRKKRIKVPKWVPTRLIVEFADCALAHGEERAARYVSKLKAELGL